MAYTKKYRTMILTLADVVFFVAFGGPTSPAIIRPFHGCWLSASSRQDYFDSSAQVITRNANSVGIMNGLYPPKQSSLTVTK
jgi:hypothetical protein